MARSYECTCMKISEHPHPLRFEGKGRGPGPKFCTFRKMNFGGHQNWTSFSGHFICFGMPDIFMCVCVWGGGVTVDPGPKPTLSIL